MKKNTKKTVFTAAILLVILALIRLLLGTAPAKYVFLLTLDTTRADAIHYEAGNPLTPNLAALAAGGVRFTEAYTPIPITLPAHTALFYAQPPHQLHITNNGQVLDLKQAGLTRILAHGGYSTAAVVSLGVLKKEFGLGQDFEDYDDSFAQGIWFRTADQVTEAAKPLISKRKGKKSFFWLHYSDPHDPYLPPAYSLPVTLYQEGVARLQSDLTAIQHIDHELTLQPGDNRLEFAVAFPQDLSQGRGELLLTHFSWQGEHQDELEILINPGSAPGVRQLHDHTGQPRFFVRDRLEIFIRNRRSEPVQISLNCDLGLEWKSPGMIRRLYQEEVSYMDRKIGELLTFLKKEDMFDESLFIVVGDHGEGLGEFRGHVGHIHHLNRLYMHVPLIISGQGISQMAPVSRRVSLQQLAPTILEQLKLKKSPQMHESSVFSVSSDSDSPLFFETHTPEAFYDSFSLLSGQVQLIYVPKHKTRPLELYDWSSDPLGTRDISSLPERKADKFRLLPRLRDMANLVLKNRRRGNRPDRGVEKMLKTLGYL